MNENTLEQNERPNYFKMKRLHSKWIDKTCENDRKLRIKIEQNTKI